MLGLTTWRLANYVCPSALEFPLLETRFFGRVFAIEADEGVFVFDRKLLALAPGALRSVLLAVLFMWVGLLGDIALALGVVALLALVFDAAFLPFWAAVGACVLALVLKFTSAKLSASFKFKASCDVKRSLRETLYRKLLRMGPGYTKQVSTAEVVQMAVDGTEQLESYFGQYLPQLVYAVVAPLTLFAVIAPIHFSTALVLLVFVPLIPLVIGAVQGIAHKLLGKYLDQYVSLGDGFLENLQGLTTLKIYRSDELRHKAMNEEAERFRVITMKVLRMQLNSIIVMDIVALGGAAAGIIVCLGALDGGQVTLMQFLFVALISSSFFVPMRQLGSFFHVAMNGMASSRRIFKMLDLPEPAPKSLRVEPGDRPVMQGVSYSYDGENTVLRNVDLEVPSCGLVGIVGGSGSGKSTIAMLFTGADDAYTGSISYGGNQLREIDGESLAAQVTYIGLGAYLFRGTVRDNLLMAKPDATEGEMWAALADCALEPFLREQAGLDTPVEGEGANFSGGQRQRLVLARALLHDTPIFILDEATSNVDVESEEAIMAVVARLAKDHAVVCISHRLANVVSADVIYAISHGAVAGCGSHDELLGSCEEYRKLWEQQASLEAIRRTSPEAAGAKGGVCDEA